MPGRPSFYRPRYALSPNGEQAAAVVGSMGPPKDALDVAIRLFLLGLAIPRTRAERALGLDFLEAAGRLGMLGECPVDPLLLLSLVQLFPLDAEALVPPTAPSDGDRSRLGAEGGRGVRVGDGGRDRGEGGGGSGGSGGSREDEGRFGRSGTSRGRRSSRGSIFSQQSTSLRRDRDSRSSSREEAPPLAAGASHQECKGRGYETATAFDPAERPRKTEEGGGHSFVPAGITAAAASVTPTTAERAAGVVAPSDMIFATDWPPPGSTALTEEPVSGSR